MSRCRCCAKINASILLMGIAGLASISRLEAEDKAAAPPAAKVTYEDHVQPILRLRCFTCHNPNKLSGGLNMTNYTGLMQGGGSGAVIEPGSSGDSYLFMLVTHQSQPNMPPGGGKIPAKEIETIKQWIDGGALANAGSKPAAPKKPKFDFALKGAPIGKPEGPPPMPGRLALEPVVHTVSTTAVTALATSPWAPLIAVGGQKQVFLYHSQSLELLGVLPFPEGVPQVLKFSSTGSLLLAGGGRSAERGRVIVWNVKTGERVFEIGDELDTVLAADISADQSRIALGGPSRIVRIYSASDGKLLTELKKHTDWITSISFSPDGVLLATGDRNGGMFVWEAQTAREYLTLPGHTASITGLSWRADANILASSSEDGTVRLWEMENGGNVKAWTPHPGGTTSVEFTRDGRVVSCGRDKLTKLWDQNGAEQKAFPALSDIALQVTHCDETNRVIAGDWTGGIKVWNAADGKQVGELTSNPQPLAARLALVTQSVGPLEAESKKLAGAYQAAQAAADKTKTDLEAATKTLAEATKKGAEGAAVAKQATEEIAKLTGEKDAAAKQIAALDPVVALLTDGSEKLRQAAEKASDDKDLAAAIAQLKAQYDKKAATLAEQKKAVAEKSAAHVAATQRLAVAEKQVAEAKPVAEASKKQVDALTPTLPPLVTQATAAKQAADAAKQSFTQAQLAVSRWQGEIEFVGKLKELAGHEARYNELLAAQDVEQKNLETAKAAVAAANQQVEASQKQVAESAAALKQAQDGHAKTAAEEAASIKALADLQVALPVLKETLDKGQQAAAKAPGDAEVAAAVAGLKAVFDKKSADLAAGPKTLEARKAAVAKAKEGVTAAETKAAEMAKALEAARAVTAEKTAAAKPVEEKFAAAKAAADAAKAVVEKFKATLEAPATVRTAQADVKTN